MVHVVRRRWSLPEQLHAITAVDQKYLNEARQQAVRSPAMLSSREPANHLSSLIVALPLSDQRPGPSLSFATALEMNDMLLDALDGKQHHRPPASECQMRLSGKTHGAVAHRDTQQQDRGLLPAPTLLPQANRLQMLQFAPLPVSALTYRSVRVRCRAARAPLPEAHPKITVKSSPTTSHARSRAAPPLGIHKKQLLVARPHYIHTKQHPVARAPNIPAKKHLAAHHPLQVVLNSRRPASLVPLAEAASKSRLSSGQKKPPSAGMD